MRGLCSLACVFVGKSVPATVADMDDADDFRGIVDGVNDPIDVWTATVEQLAQVLVFRSRVSSLREFIQAEDQCLKSIKPFAGER